MEPSPSLRHSQDRRRHARRAAEPVVYLLFNDAPARLMDWSFGGLGIRLEQDAVGLAVGTTAEVRVLRRDGGTWSPLHGTIRHLDEADRTIGLELDDDPENTPVLLELLRVKLGETTLPE